MLFTLLLPLMLLLAAPMAMAQPASPASGAPAPAQEQPEKQLETFRSALETIDKQLQAETLTDADMSRLRQSLDETRTGILGLIGTLTPRADAVNAQLEQLGAKPAEGAEPESESIATERADKSAALSAINANIRLAEALMVQGGQLSTTISDMRRTAFARSLFARSYSLFSPTLWNAAAKTFSTDISVAGRMFSDWGQELRQRFNEGGLFFVGAAVLAGVLLHWLRLRVLPRLTWRNPEAEAPSRLERVLKALGIMLARTVPVAGANLVLAAALEAENLLDGRITPVLVWMLTGFVAVVFMRALADALFAPNLPSWRLFEVEDGTAHRLSRTINQATIIILAGKIAQSIVAAIGAGLPLVVLTDGLSALAVAALMGWALRGMRRDVEPVEADGFGPYVPPDQSYRGLMVGVLRLVTLVIVVSVLAGYVAFGSFLVSQVVWVLIILGLYFLLRVFVEELVEELPKRDSRAAIILQTGIGLRRRTIEQLGVLTAGALKVLLLAIAILMIAAPWGMESNDIYSSMQAVHMGFRIGEITIAPSDILTCIFTFVIVIAITHALQNWLENKFLPLTGFDAGIRNSIRTGVGYIGFFLALLLASTQLGLSLSRISLVASALSVGIGFGLQSIVNNFVSGLILLWERPIRVGDWVVVGSDQGYVRKINVRATEIETFDRASVIVPNSSLVSGTVKNWLHNGKMGRITISIGVAYDSDEDEVRRIMTACADAHEAVLKNPVPTAHLMEFTDTKMRFDLNCFVGNIEQSGTVTNALNLAILKQLRARGYIPPRPLAAEAWDMGPDKPAGTPATGRKTEETSEEPPMQGASAQGASAQEHPAQKPLANKPLATKPA